MNILSKYVLKEHAWPFSFSMLTIVFLFILNTIFRDLGRLLGKDLPFIIIFQFFTYNLAWIVSLAVPMSVLLSTLMAFGRMSADHEITALKASGIHFYKLVFPIAVTAILFAAGMERFNNIVLPEVNHKLRLLYSDISRKRPSLSIEPNVFTEIQASDHTISILAEKVDNRTNSLEGIIISDHSKSNIHRTIIAQSGTITFIEAQEKLVFQLFDGEIHEVELNNMETYRKQVFSRQDLPFTVPNTTLQRREQGSRGNREKSAAMLRRDAERNIREIKNRKDWVYQMGINDFKNVFPFEFWKSKEDSAAYQAPLEPHYDMLELRINRIIQHITSENRLIDSYEKTIANLEVEIYKKASIPTACLVFVLIGAPLGIMMRQGGFAVAGGSGLVFFIIYWVFLIGGEQLADRKLITPFMAMWLPNLIVGAGGVYLMIWSVKESNIIPWKKWGFWLKSKPGFKR